jgi:hypothetical protein
MSATEYAVTSQEYTTGTNPTNGAFEKGWDVSWTDAVTGLKGTTFVPDSLYTADGARTLIMHTIATLRAIQGAQPSE